MTTPSSGGSCIDGASDPDLAVPMWMHVLGGWIHRHPHTWIRLGNLETRILQDVIAETPVEHPIYIAGLARSGTTILLEQLAEHPHVATHRYADFPPLLTPYWWNRWLSLVPRAREVAQERAHKDGIAVTSQSPEAFEEMLWMAFFSHIHDPNQCEVFDSHASHPAFERFYDGHIRKLLTVRRRRRYVAKGNYNLVRLGYLHKLYPGARFLVAIRDPVWHIASLMKQQKLFSNGEANQPRALEHMRRVGHFEFGLDRRAVNVGDDAMTNRISELWKAGQEVEGWALYWSDIYRHVADTLDADPVLREACLVVHYEDLCNQPEEMLMRIHRHCQLPVTPGAIREAASGLHAPIYYRPQFTERDLSLIKEITRPVVTRFS